jgi:hypothetical protein
LVSFSSPISSTMMIERRDTNAAKTTNTHAQYYANSTTMCIT